ncbi:type II secretion system minor pseudopilin GspK [Serratia odorifera]|uniref:type II secretion system minor pseudopilin GspK n=1 Tax=Serratia odorifera TaxID=618 RepID=UPI0018E879DD|nr:type II secretion system minor pseudopilin GspK [Serratia odorifera]MBJ2066877.1 type II secretion system minor pseudopilin GspK [Serratia odorifera]
MKQRGMALLIVLLMVATMAAVAVNTQEYWLRAVNRAESQQFRQQAKWTLLGAEEWVRLQLLEGLPSDSVHLGQRWAQAGQRFQLDDVTVAYQLHDNHACFNLNAVRPVRAQPTEATTPAPARAPLPQRLFQQLMLQQGMNETQAATLTASLAAATPLRDSSQLRALPGVDRPRWQRLQPLVCVQPHHRLRINANTLSGAAGAELLTALTQGHLSPRQAQARLAARPATGWPSVAALIGQPPNDAAVNAFAELQSVVTLSSDDMELRLWTEQGQHRHQLRSRLVRSEQGFRVTERRYGITE